MPLAASPLRRTGLVLALVLFAVAAVGLAERRVRAWWVAQVLPEPDIAWIWDAGWPADPVRAHAFQAARAFELPAAAPRGRLLVQGDEEYRLYLNGTWVGANHYQAGAPWDAYDVGPYLRRGENLLVVELRSGRGVGGLLVCLELVPGGPCVLESDGAWVTFRERQPDLITGEADWASARPALVWGDAPTGRWPLPGAVQERPILAGCVDYTVSIEPRRLIRLDDVVIATEDGEQVLAPSWQVRWPKMMRGELVVRLPEARRQVGIMTFSRRPGEATDPRTALPLVTQPGQDVYRTTLPHRFRFAQVVGIETVAAGLLHPMRPECAGIEQQPRAATPGLLSLLPPPLRTPVEDELRRQL